MKPVHDGNIEIEYIANPVNNIDTTSISNLNNMGDLGKIYN